MPANAKYHLAHDYNSELVELTGCGIRPHGASFFILAGHLRMEK